MNLGNTFQVLSDTEIFGISAQAIIFALLLWLVGWLDGKEKDSKRMKTQEAEERADDAEDYYDDETDEEDENDIEDEEEEEEEDENALEEALEALNLSKECSWSEIQRAYREIAKNFHPDVLASKDLPPMLLREARERFEAATDAYKLLRHHFIDS